MRTRSDGKDQARKRRGVSLIELLVGVAIAAILTLQSLPSLLHWMDQRAVQDHADSLRSALRLARAQAMRRDVEVTMCPLAPGGTIDQPACWPNSRNWSPGWVIFVDRGLRGQLGQGDQVLQIHQGLPHEGRVLSTLDAITFLPTGVSSSASARFTFLPPSAGAEAKTHALQVLVCVNKPGRPRMVVGLAC